MPSNSSAPSPLLPIQDELPARLIVDPPHAQSLAAGRVFISYRTEHLRLLPVFGPAAVMVSPRIGHVHVTVDDCSWHFIDASGDTLVLVGLSPGTHRVRIDLANPAHEVIASETVQFTVPTPSSTSPPSS